MRATVECDACGQDFDFAYFPSKRINRFCSSCYFGKYGGQGMRCPGVAAKNADAQPLLGRESKAGRAKRIATEKQERYWDWMTNPQMSGLPSTKNKPVLVRCRGRGCYRVYLAGTKQEHLERDHVLRSCTRCGDPLVHQKRHLCEPCHKQYRREKRGIQWDHIAERDGWMCWLCLGTTWTLEWNPMYPPDDYPSVDHIILISKGGSDRLDNVLLAHWGCNTSRADTVIA